MKLVNLFTGQKRLILENYKSYSNIQLKKIDNNYNFFVFWDEDIITKDEEYILKKTLKNYNYKIIKKELFIKKYKKIFNKINLNKLLNNNDKNNLIAWLHQYYILNEAFIYAKKTLGSISKQFFWQRIRSDNFIPNKINVDQIIKSKIKLHFPGAKFAFGLNDFHCIGNYHSFKIYAESINLLKILVNNSIYLPPELIVSSQLVRNKTEYTINRSLPTCLIGKKQSVPYIRSLISREKSYQYIDFNFSNYKPINNDINKSEKFLSSLFRRFYYYINDIYTFLLFYLRKLN